MYFTQNYLLQNEDKYNIATESYKTMKLTWDNLEQCTREMQDKIDIEADLAKIILLESEYLKKLNEFYDQIEKDKLNFGNKLMNTYIPNAVTALGILIKAMNVFLNVNFTYKRNNVTTGLSIATVTAGLVMRLKTSKPRNFKKTALSSINSMKEDVKTDIKINQKLLSVGIKTKQEASNCSINVTKDDIEIYRKYK